jgi:hypothetical protein
MHFLALVEPSSSVVAPPALYPGKMGHVVHTERPRVLP